MNQDKPWESVIIDDPHELLTDETRKELLARFEKQAKARLGDDREGVKRVMVISRMLPDHDLHVLTERIKECPEPRPLDRFIIVPSYLPCVSARVCEKFEAMEKEKVNKTKRSNRSPGKTLGKKKWWEKR